MAEVNARSGDLSPAKRKQILNGARLVFSELGYERASVDLIAARAGVSKATIYNHFADKKALFVAGFFEESNELRTNVLSLLDTADGDVTAHLRNAGEQFMRLLLSPPAVAISRIIMAESSRFPELGEAFFQAGQHCMRERMSAYLRRWAELGALRIDDPSRAAVHFVALCKGDLHSRAQLGVQPAPTEDDIRETVRAAVDVFVRAYRA